MWRDEIASPRMTAAGIPVVPVATPLWQTEVACISGARPAHRSRRLVSTTPRLEAPRASVPHTAAFTLCRFEPHRADCTHWCPGSDATYHMAYAALNAIHAEVLGIMDQRPL